MLSARDAGLPMPAGALAFSAGADATGSGESMSTRDGIDPVFTAAALRGMRPQYVADADPAQPLLSPSIAADLRGLPPLLLQVGTHEVLLDDTIRLATRAAHADVTVTMDVVAGVPQVFQSFAGQLDEADAALDRAAAFIRERVLANSLQQA